MKLTEMQTVSLLEVKWSDLEIAVLNRDLLSIYYNLLTIETLEAYKDGEEIEVY